EGGDAKIDTGHFLALTAGVRQRLAANPPDIRQAQQDLKMIQKLASSMNRVVKLSDDAFLVEPGFLFFGLRFGSDAKSALPDSAPPLEVTQSEARRSPEEQANDALATRLEAVASRLHHNFAGDSYKISYARAQYGFYQSTASRDLRDLAHLSKKLSKQ